MGVIEVSLLGQIVTMAVCVAAGFVWGRFAPSADEAARKAKERRERMTR